ncbi:peptidoglycan-binding domain-containing protein [Streptomyces zhihengii]|uniref:Peptidoglycan-binding protein n=1 Tax=Streptomyces zhihengii TaxID=1818004 RepID=A0ABS2UTF0_9ACTN|nr:peptidoglycan-binding domain-containing protein [Streptomyces zhihengii]MBM9620831.1 peptidoglycan-binding protein [Streptomyces zhihengii]
MTRRRTRMGVLGAAAMLFAAGLTASPVMTTPAHAAYGPCNTTVKRTDGVAVHNYYVVPARSGNGLSCYMRYATGSANAVTALQKAILRCYGTTAAAQKIRDSGGADGSYGTGTVEAVRWLQANRLGVSADGVYGPATRAAMKWPDYWRDPSNGQIRFIDCYNPPF